MAKVFRISSVFAFSPHKHTHTCTSIGIDKNKNERDGWNECTHRSRNKNKKTELSCRFDWVLFVVNSTNNFDMHRWRLTSNSRHRCLHFQHLQCRRARFATQVFGFHSHFSNHNINFNNLKIQSNSFIIYQIILLFYYNQMKEYTSMNKWYLMKLEFNIKRHRISLRGNFLHV